jgi:hypothetical protein
LKIPEHAEYADAPKFDELETDQKHIILYLARSIHESMGAEIPQEEFLETIMKLWDKGYLAVLVKEREGQEPEYALAAPMLPGDIPHDSTENS